MKTSKTANTSISMARDVSKSAKLPTDSDKNSTTKSITQPELITTSASLATYSVESSSSTSSIALKLTSSPSMTLSTKRTNFKPTTTTNISTRPPTPSSSRMQNWDLTKCFKKGKCQGHVLHYDKVQNVSSCLSECKSNPNCKWSTFDQTFHFCTQLSTCTDFKVTKCSSCITSSRICPDELPCNITGKCQVSISKIHENIWNWDHCVWCTSTYLIGLHD